MKFTVVKLELKGRVEADPRFVQRVPGGYNTSWNNAKLEDSQKTQNQHTTVLDLHTTMKIKRSSGILDGEKQLAIISLTSPLSTYTLSVVAVKYN